MRHHGHAAPVPSSGPGRIERVPQLPARVLHEIAKRGWAEDPRVARAAFVAAGLLVVAYVAAASVARSRGRRLLPRAPRWSLRAAFGGSLGLLLVFGGAVAVNSYVGYVPGFGSVTGRAASGPTVVAAGRGRHPVDIAGASTVLEIEIGAPSLGIPDKPTYVYLPPGYESAAEAHRRYPVVYLFHGSPGDAIDWPRAGRMRQTADTLLGAHLTGPMIIVAPTVSMHWHSDQECLNTPGGPQFETYLAQTVVDTIDARFRTIPDRAHRAIGGMSSGAFCALNIGLRHLHRFSVILASEPYPNPGVGPLHAIFHGDRVAWLANSPGFYIPFLRFRQPVATFLDAGTRDRHGLPTSYALARELTARGQDVGLRIAPGQRHTWYTARLELPYALRFAWQHLGHLPDGGSDAADAAAVRAVEVRARAEVSCGSASTAAPCGDMTSKARPTR